MKIKIFIFLLLLSASVYAQNSFTIEAGYIPTASSIDYSDIIPQLSLNENVFYIELDTRIYMLNYIFAGGSVMTYMLPNTNMIAMFPFYTSYTFEVGAKVGLFEVGWEHRCSHPIAAIGYAQEPLYKAESSSDKIYVKIDFLF